MTSKGSRLQCDQLCFRLSHNKCFSLVLLCLCLFRTCTAVPKIYYVENSSAWLSNHKTERSNIQCVSAPTTTILPTSVHLFHHGLYCFGHVIYALQIKTYQNILKLLSHPCNNFLNLFQTFFHSRCSGYNRWSMRSFAKIDLDYFFIGSWYFLVLVLLNV